MSEEFMSCMFHFSTLLIHFNLRHQNNISGERQSFENDIVNEFLDNAGRAAGIPDPIKEKPIMTNFIR